jgi:hypothetical protein
MINNKNTNGESEFMKGKSTIDHISPLYIILLDIII